jgi:hypothetical protein
LLWKALVLVALTGSGLAFCTLANTNSIPVASSAEPAPLRWLELKDPNLQVCGLPWFKDNAPDLWRLPASAKEVVPRAVWSRALVPDGGRIRLFCNTTRLGIRAQAARDGRKRCFLDTYIAGQFAGSVNVSGTQRVDLVLFEKKERAPRDITIYLPNNNQVQVLAVGVDADSDLQRPPPFARQKPIVCYGSSVLQGTGAAHPSSTYPAALARRLNLDFVNLGFGGAGKAEPEVVSLVNQLDACAYLFDLGKSYGAPTPDRYSKMLDVIRASHPGVPIFCVTPIYSLKEGKEPAYLKRSEDLRQLMRSAANERRQAGDKQMYVVEGLELCGEPDKGQFSDELHPNDIGNERMAERLAPVVKQAVFGDAVQTGNTAAPK